MDKFGVSKENKGKLNNSEDRLDFINDICEKITTYYAVALSDNLLDINIKVLDNLNSININILTKTTVNKKDFSNFELSMRMLSKLNGFNLKFKYSIN